MLRQFIQRISLPLVDRDRPETNADYAAAAATLKEQMDVLSRDPYLQIADASMGLISVFDDLKYDRADADILSVAMRNHALRKLAPLGFKQTSGTVIYNAEADVKVLMPKFHALGASPFDVARYTLKRDQDFYLLTPTQTACMFIDNFGREEAAARIEELIAKHPVNLMKLVDYLERKDTHTAFKDEVGYLLHVQRKAVASEPLMRRRALR